MKYFFVPPGGEEKIERLYRTGILSPPDLLDSGIFFGLKAGHVVLMPLASVITGVGRCVESRGDGDPALVEWYEGFQRTPVLSTILMGIYMNLDAAEFFFHQIKRELFQANPGLSGFLRIPEDG